MNNEVVFDFVVVDEVVRIRDVIMCYVLCEKFFIELVVVLNGIGNLIFCVGIFFKFDC